MSTPTETRLREAVKLLRGACEEALKQIDQAQFLIRCDGLNRWTRAHDVLDHAKTILAATAALDQEPTP